MSSCLVTGGVGFIGSHLVDSLIDKGHEVVVIDNLSTGNFANFNDKSYFYNNDINSNLDYIFALHKFDYVFHQAAQINLRTSIKDPYLDAHTNILGSLNIIQTALKHNVKHIFFASTGGAIYDSSGSLPWTESTFANPSSPYGLAKLTVERYLELFKTLHGLNYTILRYSNVYGPRQNSHGEAGVISIFLDKIKNNQDLIIFGDGSQTRDFVYVKDVVNANIHALENNLSGTYNVCTNSETSIIDLARLLILKSNKNIQIQYKLSIVGEVLKTRLSYNKLLSTGWQPKSELVDNINTLLKDI